MSAAVLKELPEELEKEFLRGIRQFNDRQFFDCHETLEDVWRAYLEPDREFIQGIIQIAVAYYHLLRGNCEGTRKLFERGLPRVKKYGRCYFGLDMENFVAKVEKDYSRFENEASPVREQFLIPIIEIIGPRSDC